MSEPLVLNDNVWASGQIAPQELAALAARLGLRRVINNRPDHEEPGQPSSVEMRAAAEAAGLDYLEAPVRGMPDPDMVARVGEWLAEPAPTLMFCRSGMRSAAIWAMAEAARGADADLLRAQASAAGFDLSRLPL
ncbi:MAG: TIGR01244 family sulfur transferase [Brevundimonas sp.]